MHWSYKRNYSSNWLQLIVVQYAHCGIAFFQLTEVLEDLWSKDEEPDFYKTDFIVIGPIDQFIQLSTGE